MAPAQFHWQTINKVTPWIRIQFLEDALEVADQHCTELAALIESSTSALGSGTADGQVEFLKEWARKVDAHREDRKAVQLLVGVQGQTGAGKSSLLNAILGFEDLLPCSSAEASTATICKVVYNNSKDPKAKFQASVIFRSRRDVKKELDDFFEDLKERKRLLKPGPDDPELSREEREKGLEDVNANIRTTADIIKAVWGKDLAELETMTTDNLLEKGDPVEKLVGGTRTISARTSEEFSQMVKPYLDSTHTEMTGRSGHRGRTMALWPLIDHVEIRVDAPILRSGIVLVDLPGLNDAISGRNMVARRFYETLDVAIVVAPCVRAADESTGVELMNRNQELQMRMDDKYDSGFCVVLSKMDDIDWRASAKQEGRTSQIQNLENLKKQTKESMEARARVDRELKKVRASLKQAKDTSEKERLTKKIEELRAQRRDHGAVFKTTETQYEVLKGEAKFLAIQKRNSKLTRRIVKELEHRHKAWASDAEGPRERFNAPRIFPVSVRALRAIRTDTKDEAVGFPSELYTGVPALLRWLHEVTIPKRIDRVMVLLGRYLMLLNNLFTWSDDQCRLESIEVDAQDVIKSVEQHCGQLKAKLEKYSDKLRLEVRKCDPFHSSWRKALNKCGELIVIAVDRWELKEPEDDNSLTRMSWATHGAIIRRGGGEFTSRVGKVKKRYNWMEELAHALLRKFAGRWARKLHREIPGLKDDAFVQISKIWGVFMTQISNTLEMFFPELKGPDGYLSRQTDTLLPFQAQLNDALVARLRAISQRSPEIRRGLTESMKEKWKPAFDRAAKVKGGKGIMQRRQDALNAWAATKGAGTFQDVIEGMERDFKKDLDAFPVKLGEAWGEVNVNLLLQLSLIVDKILEARPGQDSQSDQNGGDGKSGSSRQARRELQQKVQALVIQWSAAWMDTKLKPEKAGNAAIPSTYKVPRPDGDDDDCDDEDEDEDDDDMDYDY